MQLIGFSFTREKSEFSHLCLQTHFALCMPLVVLSRRRLTVSSEMRLLNDLFVDCQAACRKDTRRFESTSVQASLPEAGIPFAMLSAQRSSAFLTSARRSCFVVGFDSANAAR
jgi:hypothetical protein